MLTDTKLKALKPKDKPYSISDGQSKQTNNKRGPTSKLQKQLDRVSTLPRSKQKFVIDIIDTIIQQAS